LNFAKKIASNLELALYAGGFIMTTAPNPSQSAFSAPSQQALNMPLMVALGIFFWFVAAMAIRFLGSSVFVAGSIILPVTFFVLSPPIAWAFVWAAKIMGGIQGQAIFPAAVILSSIAMFCDGVAITFFPALYGLPSTSLVMAGAWLLWGVALIQTIAFVQAQRSN
jgi:hypothetical protein